MLEDTSPMRSRFLLIIAATAFAGCGDLVGQISSDKVAIAILAATPDLKNPETGENVPGETTLTVYFGDVDKSRVLTGNVTSDDFTPIDGAEVRLTFTDAGGAARDLVVPGKGSGAYALESVSEPGLTYAEVDYTLSLASNGKLYRMKVRPPPRSDIVEIAAAQDRVIRDHPAGSPLTITRSDARGSDNASAFVSLAGADASASAPAYTNAPSDALGFLRLVLHDSAWRADAFTIPGDAFAPSAAYLVTLLPLERGSLVSSGGASSLSLGSVFLAGAAAGGGVLTR